LICSAEWEPSEWDSSKQDTNAFIPSSGVSNTDTAFTLKAGKHGPAGVDGNHPQNGVQQGAHIRRLTPRECMRLQGVPDYITDKLIAAGISDTQMYRSAGDACSVPVIYAIAKAMTGSTDKLEAIR